MSKKLYHEICFKPGKLYIVSQGDHYKSKPFVYLYGHKHIMVDDLSVFYDLKEGTMVFTETICHLYILNDKGKISHLFCCDEEINGNVPYMFEELD